MYIVPDELSAEIYVYDESLIVIAKSLLKTHSLKSLSKSEFVPLMDLIRYNAVNEIPEDSPAALGDYLEKAIHYTYTNVHALGIFIIGHTTLEEILPNVADNLSSRNNFPNRYIDNATKFLARAISDYLININELLKDPQEYKEHLWFLALWLAFDFKKDLPEKFGEQEFLSLLYDKAYIFAEFLATWYSILSGKPLRHREGIPRTPQLEVIDWLNKQ